MNCKKKVLSRMRGKSYLVLMFALLLVFALSSFVFAQEAQDYKLGFDFGSKYKSEIIQNIAEMNQRAVENHIDLKAVTEESKNAEKAYEDMLPEKTQWMKGVADSTGISYDQIFLFNTFDKKIVGFEGECTTFLGNGKALADGKGTMITKNRDQGATALCEVSVNEASRNPQGSVYHAAYIDIPQVEETYKFVGNRTAGRWGYGMGINEHQVIVSDNDAPSRDILDFKASLHDNDVIRLILERAKTAREGVDIVTELVEKYGQAWNGIMFEIGDPNDLWVVEVTGHRWVAKQYKDTITARSNQYQIEDDYDLSSKDLIDFAQGQGWIEKGKEKIDFKKVYSCDVGYPDDNDLSKRNNVDKMYNTEVRYQRAMELLKKEEGKITIEAMMRFARDHFDTYKLPSGKMIDMDQVPFYSTEYADWEGREFLKKEPSTDNTSTHMYVRGPCSHDLGWGRTVASGILIARPNVDNELGLMLHAFSPPCNSVYVPFYVGIDKVHPDFENPKAATLFQGIATKTFGFHTQYHDGIRTHFDAYENTMLKDLKNIESTFTEYKSKDAEEASRLLNEFVMKKCDEALKAAEKAEKEITKISCDGKSWTPRE
ncbi:C69 family dipeptidase [Lutibacter sp. B2]|nr:C69 family dipeptidase [Lutibacter sp. B2]